MRLSPLNFSIVAVVILLVVFLVFNLLIINILIPMISIEETLSFTGNYFSGLTTLLATLVAAYLFNDWRDEYNQQLNSQFILNFLQKIGIIEEQMQKLLAFLMLSSQAELDNVDEIVESKSLKDFKKDFKKIETNFKDLKFNKITLGNEYYVIGDYYPYALRGIVASMNEAIITINELNDIDEQLLIKNKDIQQAIDSAIEEIKNGLEYLNEVEVKAHEMLRP